MLVDPKLPVRDREIRDFEEKLSIREHEILDELDRQGYDRGYSRGYEDGYRDGSEQWRQRSMRPNFRTWLA